MKVFLDMDGVLTDFGGAIAQKFNMTPIPGVMTKLTSKQWGELDYDFWRHLRWTDFGTELLDTVITLFPLEDVFIASSPCWTDGCCDGKRDWIKANIPALRHNVILTKHKHLLANPASLLIDDNESQCNQFSLMGGEVFLVPSPENGLHGWTYDNNALVATLDKFLYS